MMFEFKKSLTFGIDYDETFTADPEVFVDLAWIIKERGHKAYIVTQREDNGPWGDEVRKAVKGIFPIIFAGKQWKREAVRAHPDGPIKIDIWIDDKPYMICDVEDASDRGLDHPSTWVRGKTYEQWCEAHGREICPLCGLSHQGFMLDCTNEPFDDRDWRGG